MPERATIYFGKPLQQLLAGHENRSGRLNTIAERYHQMISRDCPELSGAEWCVLCDALSDTWMEKALPPRFLVAELADANRLNGLGAKWKIDVPALIRRLEGAPTSALIAVLEIVELSRQEVDLPTGEALRKAGARVTEQE